MKKIKLIKEIKKESEKNMISIGDKLVVKSQIGFLEEGEVIEVTNVDENNMVSFVFGENGKGVMSLSECEKHFEKVVEEESAPSVTSEYIENVLMYSEIAVQTLFDKCTVVACKLPNGFVIVESSACVSPENYNEEMGIDICLDKIRNKIWELEGYNLQTRLNNGEIEASDCPYDCDDCSECPCENYEDCYEEDFEEDEYDCSNCEDYDCPNNTNDKN